jgi:hypothetical protein
MTGAAPPPGVPGTNQPSSRAPLAAVTRAGASGAARLYFP